MGWLTLLSTAGVILGTAISYFIRITYAHRCKINELRRQGVPMPKEWSWVFGHLLVLQKYVDGIPSDAAVSFAMKDLAWEYADCEVFLMDFWPVYPALYIVFNPEAANQITSKHNLPKTATAARFMRPISGGPDLVSMNGDEWKQWRSIFNPGFSSGAMLNNVPHILDSMLVFREKLIERIGKGIFSLDEFTTKLSMEVILKVTLDDLSSYQRSPHVLPTALGHITAWHSFWDPRVLMNPLRLVFQGYNGRVMNHYIRRELEKRFQEKKEEKRFQEKKEEKRLHGEAGDDGNINISSNRSSPTTKSVISLALDAYMAETQRSDLFNRDRLDETFIEYATWQIRVFLFAGTDTTASIMVYVYHMLSKHPEWLAKVRQEHDDVLGKNPDDAARLLRKEPSLINNCRLTLAVVKETLRMYAPAGSMRAPGPPGTVVTDLRGDTLPVDYAGVSLLHHAIHANPRVWPRPDEFLPDRFLVEPGHELYPADPAAFRPFEQGARNCIGQTLVWNELRLAIILTGRDLVIRDAYEDFDAKREREMGALARLRRRLFGQGIRTLHGDRAYQTDTGGSHPVDGYPCYVAWANDE